MFQYLFRALKGRILNKTTVPKVIWHNAELLSGDSSLFNDHLASIEFAPAKVQTLGGGKNKAQQSPLTLRVHLFSPLGYEDEAELATLALPSELNAAVAGGNFRLSELPEFADRLGTGADHYVANTMQRTAFHCPHRHKDIVHIVQEYECLVFDAFEILRLETEAMTASKPNLNLV